MLTAVAPWLLATAAVVAALVLGLVAADIAADVARFVTPRQRRPRTPRTHARLVALVTLTQRDMGSAQVEGLTAERDHYRIAWQQARDVAVRETVERCARGCDEDPTRDPGEDGNGYWAAEHCAAAIRALLPPAEAHDRG